MSLKFKFGNYDDNQETGEQKPVFEKYDSQGQVRNICFVQADGKQIFLNYSYLISGESSPVENSITLLFTTHTVTLKGNNLEKLYAELSTQITKAIYCIDKRYIQIKNETDSVVTEISIVRHSS